MKKIPWASPRLSPKTKTYVVDALESSWVSGGPYVERLEREFLRRLGAKRGLAVSNGTTALQLALLAAGVGPGDEVLVPGYTFVAPANMVLACGAKPVFCDIDPETWGLDAKAAEKRVTRRTKAIIAVHLYGNVCDMDALAALARRKRLILIEDAAESAFSTYKGRCAGTIGDFGCFSFQATKTITTGEGGFVVTNADARLKKMRMIRDHGMRPGKRYWHDVVGFNFRLTNLQAAVGVAQLEQLDRAIEDREKLHRLYRARLAGEAGIALQRFRPEVEPVVWALGVRIEPRVFGMGRDEVMRRLAAAGVETRPGFYPFDVLPLYRGPRLPAARAVGLNLLSLPFFPGLTSREVDYICARFKSLRKKTA